MTKYEPVFVGTNFNHTKPGFVKTFQYVGFFVEFTCEEWRPTERAYHIEEDFDQNTG